MNDFWCIIPFFNPAHYESLLRNYSIFSKELKLKKINFLTIELAFNGDPFEIPSSDNVLQLRSNSIMWQKERLINYGLKNLPNSCTNFAWIDCDVLFEKNDWIEQTVDKLKSVQIVQLFKRVFYLPKGHTEYRNQHDTMLQGVIWQNKTYRNWLYRRQNKEIPFSSPGFAWAARKSTFENGIYDKNIIGSGDTFLVDCMLDSWKIHGFAQKFTEPMKEHMNDWRSKLPNLTCDFIPQSIYHLYHGSLKNRSYMDRHDILLKYDYNPMTDINLQNDVLEWTSNKIDMHNDIKQYFFNRKEDDD